VQLDHVAPSRVGTTVTAEATLQKINGRRLTFTVSVTDSNGLVAAGILSRVVVETERFLDSAR
jgi:predicted thioesterase